jgi:hypothetical protein
VHGGVHGGLNGEEFRGDDVAAVVEFAVRHFAPVVREG